MAFITADQAGGQNFVAMLDMIAWSEGTSRFHGIDASNGLDSDNGYRVLVGSILATTNHPEVLHTFGDYSRHPNMLVTLSNTLSSTAAGRYQILYRWWSAYQAKLRLTDFSPMSQDLYALNIMREQGAFQFIRVGAFAQAVACISDQWASLAGSQYGQHTNTMDDLQLAYTNAGGVLA